MYYTLTIELDNDAFQPYAGSEIASILRGLATRAENGQLETPVIYDSNGNKVGSAGCTSVKP